MSIPREFVLSFFDVLQFQRLLFLVEELIRNIYLDGSFITFIGIKAFLYWN
jgi:hypothetical protein